MYAISASIPLKKKIVVQKPYITIPPFQYVSRLIHWKEFTYLAKIFGSMRSSTRINILALPTKMNLSMKNGHCGIEQSLFFCQKNKISKKM